MEDIRVVLVSGVAGAGKTTVGRALALRLGWTFLEGDELHTYDSIAKMSRGEPLTDTDRTPWLEALRHRIDLHLGTNTPVVISTSALRQSYRERLRVGEPGVLLVLLEAPRDLIAERLAARKGHFFGPGLLDSQFADLEPVSGPGTLVLSAEEQVDTLVEAVVAHLRT